MPNRCYRLAIVANPRLGYASFSWRIKEALERLGSCVFWFTPDRWPQLFVDGACHLEFLDALVERWGVDFVLAADGLGLDPANARTTPLLGCLAETPDDATSSLSRSSQAHLSLALGFGRETQAVFDEAKVTCQRLDDYDDPALFERALANELVCPPGIVAFDRDACDAARAEVPASEPVRCLAPGDSDLGVSHFGAMYALHGAHAVVETESRPLTAYQRHLAQGFGAPVCAPSELKDRLSNPARRDAPKRRRSLDADLSAFLGRLASAHDLPLRTARNRYACALGYFGRGNFGDEFILSTVARRLAARQDGMVTIAVGEDPWHTLTCRGIYATTLGDKAVLDAILAHADISLVCAGLLFDQGIRWTMGKAELLSSVLHTDIPGIAAFVELGHLNGVRTVFYGIGAGPLEHPDSQRLVALCGTLGALFYTRDARTAELIRACGVPKLQVKVRADAAFTSDPVGTAAAQAWLAEQGIDAKEVGLVAVSLRRYDNVDSTFAARVASALDASARRHPGTRYVFCILDQDDEVISNEVIGLMHERSRCAVFNPHDDLDLMASMLELVACGVSMRYHCSLLINRAGRPCVGLGYLPKVEALYEEVGCSEELLLGMDASSERIAEALDLELDESGSLTRRVGIGVSGLVSLARRSENELMDAMGETDPAEALRVPAPYFHVADSDRQLAAARAEVAPLHGRIAELESQLAAAQARVQELETSNSYKVGSVLMKVPGKIKRSLRR